MANNSIKMFCEDIAFLLKMVKADKPLFIYGHSMGGLTVASFLTNNPHLNISGAVLSAPLLSMPKSVGINNKKRILIDLLVPEID
jgi:alpha-beta hydrolase superfamily lysophospholipase